MDDHSSSFNEHRLARGQRYFCINGSWYFNTRAGQKGPFSSKQAMQSELDRYISLKTDHRQDAE
jgi:hypothetical protein